MRESIPFQLARVGDVFDDRGRLGVITQVEKVNNDGGVILSISADGTTHQLEWHQGTPSGLLHRVGKRCAPNVDGLRQFIVQQVS